MGSFRRRRRGRYSGNIINFLLFLKTLLFVTVPEFTGNHRAELYSSAADARKRTAKWLLHMSRPMTAKRALRDCEADAMLP
jgi:hypothetical protein